MPSSSKSQQRLMGQAHAYRKGKLKKKDINPKYFKQIKKLSKQMKPKDLKKFAKTKHKDKRRKKVNLPERVGEHFICSFQKFKSINS